jgi:hypothetical protein
MSGKKDKKSIANLIGSSGPRKKKASAKAKRRHHKPKRSQQKTRTGSRSTR